jgi:hypothetical protein
LVREGEDEPGYRDIGKCPVRRTGSDFQKRLGYVRAKASPDIRI